MLDSRHSTSLDFLRYLLQGDEKDFNLEYVAVETTSTEAKPTFVAYGKLVLTVRKFSYLTKSSVNPTRNLVKHPHLTNFVDYLKFLLLFQCDKFQLADSYD